MDTEHLAVRDFLVAHHPFDQLPEEVLATLPGQLQTRRLAAGEYALRHDTPNTHLFIIRGGAVEVLEPDGSLIARLKEGDIFGQRSLLGDGLTDFDVRAVQDTDLYLLPAERFHALRRDVAQFRFFFSPTGRLRGALQNRGQGDGGGVNLMTTPIADLLGRPPVTLHPEASIREAAELMTREKISSLMIARDDKLEGILTDRDLRRRVVAAGLDGNRPLAEIMTPDPATVDARSYAYEALLAMARSGFHHLPVLRDGRVAGMITSTDLVQRRSNSPLYLIGDIYRCGDPQSLADVSRRLGGLLVTLVGANASAHSIGHVISAVGEAINCRLLALAEQRLGPAPVPYAWLSGGSLGRQEQTAHSDQDNCLLLSDDYDPDRHGAYFEELSTWVCDALDACGYVYCPGEIMAKTPKWRQPLAVWKGYFDQWIDQPQPKALMHASIFFDLRCLYGDRALFRTLQDYILEKAQRNRIFHAYMASNALTHQPPLGFFRSFVLVKDGKHDHTLDLKHSGVVPITDLARVFALASGAAPVNTRDRLQAAQAKGAVSEQGAADLVDALEFIAMVRLRHQARQIQDGKAPDNYMPPKTLSHFERNHLKDAFSVVADMQSALSQRYQLGRF